MGEEEKKEGGSFSKRGKKVEESELSESQKAHLEKMRKADE